MNTVGIAKAAVDLVVSAGVGSVVGNAIKASTPANAKIVQKISIGIGGFVLSGLVGSAAAKYTSAEIEATTSQLKELKTALRRK